MAPEEILAGAGRVLGLTVGQQQPLDAVPQLDDAGLVVVLVDCSIITILRS